VNLFVNAAQALESGGPEENVLSIHTSFADGEFLVRIADNGPGISPDLLPGVFDPFVTTKGDQGTGLGLWVCRNIIEEHGGTIDVESSSAGTRFVIRLPLRAGGEPSLEDSAPGQSTRAGRVLVIDDEELLLRALARRLSAQHHVVTAGGGREALRRMEEDPERFDAVICDLGMPDMNGMELYEEVLARWPALARRFRFMSGAPEWSEDRALADLGVRCFRKPLEVDALTEEIHKLVARRARGRE
jgi:CheY-like chemotaxis protein